MSSSPRPASTASSAPVPAGVPPETPRPAPAGGEYDHEGEAARVAWPDVVVGDRRLNRRTATVRLVAPVEGPEAEAVRRAVRERLFTTTLAPDSPVVELGWPVHGPFVS